jgi:hypothetical protein
VACGLRDAAHRGLHLCPIERVTLERDDTAAAAPHRLFESCFRHAAIGIVRNERRERPTALARGIADNAFDVGLRQKAQQIDAARRHIGVGRERDHRHAASARGSCHRADG